MTSEALATRPATTRPLAGDVGARAPQRRDAAGTFEFEPHHCFACGELNQYGLHLAIHTSPDGSWLETTLDRSFQGWEDVAHGGIVCTILDEVMAWAVIGRGTWGVTARLSVAFRRPARTGQPLRAEGWVVQQDRRAVRAEGRVLDARSGEVFATAESTFIAVPPAELERLKARYGMRRIPGPVEATAEATATTDTTGPADA